MEISQLTRELHQRDITIASAKCSSSDMEKQLKAEMQKAEEKAVEHKVKSSRALSPLNVCLFVFKEWICSLNFQ